MTFSWERQRRRRRPWEIQARCWLLLMTLVLAVARPLSVVDLPPKTIVLGTYMWSLSATHPGTIHYRKDPKPETVWAAIQPLAESVAALADPLLQLVILHDVEGLEAHETNSFQPVFVRDLDAYRSTWGEFLPVHDVRWVMQLEYLLLNPADCVFMVDVSDVRVLKNPAGLCDSEPPGTLFVSTDVAGVGAFDTDSPFGFYIGKMRRKTGYGNDSAEWNALATRTDLPALNCGIVGGDYGAAAEYLSRVAGLLWARRNLPLMRPVDMLVTMHVAFTWRGKTVFGYPHGPVNLPFWCRCEFVPGCDCEALAASGEYYFAHKTDPSQRLPKETLTHVISGASVRVP